jgi:hypothetical protein
LIFKINSIIFYIYTSKYFFIELDQEAIFFSIASVYDDSIKKQQLFISYL